MDDQQPQENPLPKTRASRNPRTVRPPAGTKPRSPSHSAEVPVSTQPDHETEPTPTNTPKPDQDKKLSLHKIRDLVIINVAVLFVAGLFQLAESATGEGKAKLQNADAVVIQCLNSLQPSNIAVNFYSRLTEQHGFVIYQWDAPFNADVAKFRLEGLDDNGQSIANREPDDNSFLGSKSTVDPNVAAGQAMAEAPLGSPTPNLAGTPSTFGGLDTGGLTHIQQNMQKETTPYSDQNPAGIAKIDRYVLLKGVNIVTLIIALPDAYMYMIRQLLPHDSILVAVCLASLVFFIARSVWLKLDEKKDGWGLIMALIYLPLVVSLTEWVVQKAGLGAADAFHNLLAAPAIAVTGTLGLNPVFKWAAGKLAEHHLSEFTHTSVRRAIVHEVSEEEKKLHL